MRRHAATVLALSLAALAAASPAGAAHAAPPAAAAPAAEYSITDLGMLPGFGPSSSASAVNNAGMVVGYIPSITVPERAFRWAAGTMTDLGTLPGAGLNSRANAINDAGQVTGLSTRHDSGYAYPVRWSASGAITDLGGPVQNELGWGNAIDRLGRVAGGQRPGSSEGDPEATLYKVDGQRSRLGPGLSIANGMNDRGQIVGGNWVWRASTVTHLTGLPSLPDLGVMARAINVSGVVVGSAATGTGPVQPALWRNGKITDLGSLPGITHSTARAINAAGDVVGTADDECFPCAAPRAWRWRAGVLTPLDDLIPAGSGWTLREANGVNDRGQIVGTGLHNGTTRAYLLTPRVHINISFGPASAPLPVGYNRDSGAVYGPRPGGLTYGWNSDNSALTRDRDAASSPDQRYDTLTHLQKPGSASTWELAVPNGTYRVHAVSGDPRALDSVFRLTVEGVVAVSGVPTDAEPWLEGTVTVTVTDGKLTIGNGAGAVNNKINYLDIVSN